VYIPLLLQGVLVALPAAIATRSVLLSVAGAGWSVVLSIAISGKNTHGFDTD
jgi:hypothetical protein